LREDADAHPFLFTVFLFGLSLLFLERGPRKRAQLIVRSAEKLVDDFIMKNLPAKRDGLVLLAIALWVVV
jgi:hypothetical protein